MHGGMTQSDPKCVCGHHYSIHAAGGGVCGYYCGCVLFRGSPLLPCPFCGGPADMQTLDDPDGVAVTIGCGRSGCPIYIVAGPYPTEAEAIAAWNRRAP